jgi:hypothetical protein
MPKAPSCVQSDVDTKPYVRPEGETTPPPPKQKKASGSPIKKGPGSPSKAQGWSLEDKQTLLLAVLATAKPDFASIARDKFPTRNANQVSRKCDHRLAGCQTVAKNICSGLQVNCQWRSVPQYSTRMKGAYNVHATGKGS